MVSMPLFAIFLIAAGAAVKWGQMKAGAVILGVLVGLTMAATSFGPPILEQVNAFSAMVAREISQAAN